MIRPYIAIIRDSFHAAISSRVLYIVLLLIVLLLAILTPLHVREQVDWRLNLQQHISNPDRLVTRLVEDGKSGDRAEIARIWERLPDSLQNEMTDLVEQLDQPGDLPPEADGGAARLGTYGRLVAELNRILADRDFYDETTFSDRRLSTEARDLIDKGVDHLTDVEVKRLNRLLVDSVLRRNIARPGATQLDFYYFNWHWSAFTTNSSHAQFAHGLSSLLPGYFDKFVMSIGIFIAILVTASIIPEMLEPGSLNLLLSKPIHRWALLLTKFVGGCAFILLCATLFFAGIWIWLGVQMSVWEQSILLSIPIYVFVFGMYYSVSVLAGVWFRSAILSITFAILFWAACFVIGVLYGRLENRQYNFGARQIDSAGTELIYVDILQNSYRWENDRWVPFMERSKSPQDQALAIAAYLERLDEIGEFPGPVFDSKNQRIVAGSAELQPSLIASRFKLVSASGRENWSHKTIGDLPANTLAMFHSDKFGLLAVNDSAQVFQLDPESETVASQTTQDAGNSADQDNKKPDPSQLQFVSISDNPRRILIGPGSVSFNPTNDELAIYSEGDIVILTPGDDGKYVERAESEVGELQNARMTSWIQYRGDRLFLAFGNGRLYQFDQSLGEIFSTIPETRVAIRSMTASPDGRWLAVVYRDGRLWLYDADSTSEHRGSRITGQGDVLAATFDDDHRLWIADRFQNAVAIDVEELRVDQELRPTKDWLTRLFQMGVRPLYRIFPRPGEFYRLISHISSSNDAQYSADVDLTGLPTTEDPWSPLRNGVVFMAAVLAIACIQFQRQDF